MPKNHDICQKTHRYAEIFETLPENQGGLGRHKCPGCAYEKGFLDGLNGIEKSDPEKDPKLLYSQAGTVRHKDVRAAYDLGYKRGAEDYKLTIQYLNESSGNTNYVISLSFFI